MTLFDDDPQFIEQTDADLRARRKSIDAELADGWIGVIMESLQRMLAVRREIHLASNVEELYGPALTLAGSTEVRAAVKALYKAGVTSTPGTGDLHTMTVVSSIAPGS